MPENLLRQTGSLGEVLSILMIRRQMNGIQVAERAGITAPSFSRILNGIVRPRQGTLTKIIQALCISHEEQQMVISGYGLLPDKVEEELPIPVSQNGEVPKSELERVARYLEMKSMSIDFMKSVARTLQDAGIKYETNVINGSVVTDFLVERNGRRIAIECKFNVNRDWEREVATARLLRERLPCDQVFIVIPYMNGQKDAVDPALKLVNATVVLASKLTEAI
jgi:transcriptional regulator with XRE-family HTH domain